MAGKPGKPNLHDDRLLSLEAFRREMRSGTGGITTTIAALTALIDTLKTGWAELGESAHYYAAGQIWVAGDQLALFQAGLRIRFYQAATTKYFRVVSSTKPGDFTVITITGDTLTSDTIFDLHYSLEPQGFPTAYANAALLDNLKTVDGTGSGLDADLLDGLHAADITAPASTGWTAAGQTWTRTADTTFTVAGDLTALYQKGLRISCTQNSATRYCVVLSSSHAAGTTTVTVAGDALTAHTITDPRYSYTVRPQGFPVSWEFTPANVRALTGTITTVGTCSGTWWIYGGLMHTTVFLRITTNGTGGNAVVYDSPLAIADGQSMVGREMVNGKMLFGLCQSNSVYIRNYDSTYPGFDSCQLRLSGVFALA